MNKVWFARGKITHWFLERKGYIALALLIIVLVAFLGWLLIGVTILTINEGECSRHGFPEASVWGWNNVTCYRFEEGSTVARPLDWVKLHCDEFGRCDKE